MLRSHARFEARQSEPHVSKLYCYIMRILLLHVRLTVCSFVPRGSNCMPGTKMATVTNGTSNSPQKVSIEHRVMSTAVPSLCFFASNSSAHLIAMATSSVLLTHCPSSTDFGLLTLLAYNYMIFCSYLFFLDLTKVPRSLSLLALSCRHLYTLEITHNCLLQQFFGKDGYSQHLSRAPRTYVQATTTVTCMCHYSTPSMVLYTMSQSIFHHCTLAPIQPYE